MFELIKAGEQTSYFALPSAIGVYTPDGKNVYLIDSGPHKDNAKKVLRVLRENGRVTDIKGILVTHAHADHIGGCAYLREMTGCTVFASDAEADYIRHPYLEAATLYGACPHRDLQHKFLLAQSCETVLTTDARFPQETEIIALSGHSYDMVGYRTPDDVVFLADSLCSEATLQKYGITFLFDVGKTLQTLEMLQHMQAKLFIPSHAPATDDITDLVALNISKINETAECLLDFCKDGIAFDALLQRVFERYGLNMTHEQHVLIGSTVRSYLSWLYNRNLLQTDYVQNVQKWIKV